MLFNLTSLEEADVIQIFHRHASASKAGQLQRQAEIVTELRQLVAQALSQKRLPDDRLDQILVFLSSHPDLKEKANGNGFGYSQLITDTHGIGSPPYTDEFAEVLRLRYF